MLTALREVVEERIELGDRLERIEAEVVDPAPLDEERRAALWLYAWCRAQEARPERRPARSSARRGSGERRGGPGAARPQPPRLRHP